MKSIKCIGICLFILTFFSSCVQMLKPELKNWPEMQFAPIPHEHQATDIVNGCEDDAIYKIGKASATITEKVSYHEWSEYFVKMIKSDLKKMGVGFQSDSSRIIKVQVTNFVVDTKFTHIDYYITVSVSTEDEVFKREFTGVGKSISGYVALDDAINDFQKQLFKDSEFLRYVFGKDPYRQLEEF